MLPVYTSRKRERTFYSSTQKSTVCNAPDGDDSSSNSVDDAINSNFHNNADLRLQ